MNYDSCNLCPRHCGVDRTAGQLGFCRMGAKPVVARADLHHWEEPIISGEQGSGTIFFAGCSLRCAFCQNEKISHGLIGQEIDEDELYGLCEYLVAQGAENINFVTPGHFLPSVVAVLKRGIPVPVVYNCGGYETVEALKALEGLVDVYLPDLKFFDQHLSKQLTSTDDYFQVATQAISEMYRQTGNPQYENGRIIKGTMVRHLIMPGHVENSLDIIEWFSKTFPNGEAIFSLMSQYTPCGSAQNTPPFHRCISQEEYAGVVSYMNLCGIKDGYTQELSAASAQFIPDFSDNI